MSPSGRKHKLYDIMGEYGNCNYILIAVDFKIVAYIDNCCQQYLGENLASCRLLSVSAQKEECTGFKTCEVWPAGTPVSEKGF